MIRTLSPLLMIIALVSSCSNDIEDKTKQLKNATFSATRVVAYSTLPTKLKNWSDFQSGNHIELMTCIKNKGINAPVVNDQFTVYSPGNGPAQKTSDENGCIYWGLYKNFDFLTREHYAPYTIKIVGSGKHKGRLTIPLAINPWKDTSNTIKDLRFDQLASRHIQKTLQPPEESNLHIKSTKISYKKGVFQNLANLSRNYTLSYDISLWPTYKRIGLDKELIEESFKEGTFNVTLSLMEKIPSSGQYFNISTTEQIVAIKNGFINTPVTFVIHPQHWPRGSSLLEMFIQLTPIDGPDSLGSFHGAVSMKNMAQNNHDAPAHFSPNFNYAVKTSQFRLNPDEPHEPRHDFIFEIDSIRAEYGALTSDNYKKSSQKILKSKLRLKLVSPFKQDIIQKTRFLVTVYDPDGNPDLAPERMASIDSNGVLESYALIKYNAYNCSQWLPYKIKIQAVNGQINGLEKERNILFNPWDKANFFYDTARQNPPSQTECTFPQTHVAEVEYSNEELDRENFHLDKYLNLSIRKFYNINFKPLLKTISSHQQEAPPQPITYGKFILRLDLYAPKTAKVSYRNPNLDNFAYITSAEKEVRIDEGIINENMGMPFYIDETVVLSYKNIIAITLTPKDEPFLRPATRFFHFYPQEIKKKTHTLPLKNYQLKPNALKTLNHIRKTGFRLPPGLLNSNLISPLRLFKTWLFGKSTANNSYMDLQQLNQTLDSLNDTKYSLPPLEQERLLYEPDKLAKQTLNKLCPLFYTKEEDVKLEKCLANPELHIKRRPNHHVMDIITTKTIQDLAGNEITVPIGTYKEGVNGTLQVGNRFSNSAGIRSHNGSGNRFTRTVQRHFDWGIKSPGFIGSGYGNSYAEQEMDYEANAHSQMATSFNFGYAEIKQNTLSFNSLALEFEAKIVPCFAASSRTKPDAIFYICDKKPRYTRMVEQWYFVADLSKKNNQFIADPGRIGDSRGPRIIRGRFNFNRFWVRVIEKSSLSIHRTALYPSKNDFVKQHIFQIQKSKNRLFDKVHSDGYDFFPGMYTPSSME